MAVKNQDPKIAAALKNRKPKPTSTCSCKRSFKHFATPLTRQFLPGLKNEWEPTIRDFLDVGGDLNILKSHLCQLSCTTHSKILGTCYFKVQKCRWLRRTLSCAELSRYDWCGISGANGWLPAVHSQTHRSFLENWQS